MKVLFIYPNITDYPIDVSSGLAALSGYLKAHGHQVMLFDYTFDRSFDRLKQMIIEEAPGIVGIPVAGNDFATAVGIACFIKGFYSGPLVCGGYLTTVAPEYVMSEDCFDIAVIGEGEQTLLEIIESLENNRSLRGIRGAWFKENGCIVKSPLRSLCADIDTLPFPDKNLFDYRRYLNINRGLATFISSIGCPFPCSYCINKPLMDRYGAVGYVRFKSLDYIIREIKTVCRQYSVREIEFYDETFTINKKRVLEFCEVYRNEINLPFYINARVETLDEEMVGSLKEAGCRRISMGIETGDSHVRNTVLKRNQSDRQIIDAFAMVKRLGLQTFSFNMVGIPFETKESVQKTIMLNRECRPDFLAVSIFNAYQGTELYELCRSNDWLREERGSAYFQTTNVRHPAFSPGELRRIRDTFGYEVFKGYNNKRALIDLIDKRLLKYRPYVKARSFLIRKGIKKLL